MAVKWYRCDSTFMVRMKDGPNRAFVAGNLYQLDLKNLPNKQVVESFTLVTEDGNAVVEQATASPGKTRSTGKARKRTNPDKPIMSVKDKPPVEADDKPKVEVTSDEL